MFVCSRVSTPLTYPCLPAPPHPLFLFPGFPAIVSFSRYGALHTNLCNLTKRRHWYLNKTLQIDRRDRDELGPVGERGGLQGGWYGAKNGGFNV